MSSQDSSQDPLNIIDQWSDGADRIFPVRLDAKTPELSTVDDDSEDGASTLSPAQEYSGPLVIDNSSDDDTEEALHEETSEFSEEDDAGTEGHAQHREQSEFNNMFNLEDWDSESIPPDSVQQTDGVCLVEDTPAKQHSTSTRSYQLGDLKEMRQAVKDHVGSHALELPFDEFAERFLPHLKDEFNTRAIRRRLIESGHVHRSKGVLTSFDTEPKRNKEREDNVLAPLSKTFAEICSLASRTEPECFLGMLPNYEPYASVSMRHRPDGCLLPNSKKEFVTETAVVAGETKAARNQRRLKKQKLTVEGKHFTLHDILVALEGKKWESGRDDNIAKITFHGQQLIAHDPCRRFVIGITIENTSMRLWFLSRTRPIVSESFDFTREIERLIRVVLSLSFASREELGFDPTIQLVPAVDSHQYDIVVAKRKFRTVRVIEDVKAHALISTGTRVWEAIEQDPETGLLYPESLIIKDAWIEDDRDLEMDIYARILEDVQLRYGEVIRNKVASGLMTPVAQWSVEIGEEYDCTRDTPSKISAMKLFPLKEERRRPTPTASGSRGKGPPGSHSLGASPVDYTSVQSLSRRRHYRVAFAEVGTPIYRVEKLSQAFLVLKDSTESLRYIHGSGWLHRDMSPSNIYFYQDYGLIGDLEYAKRRGSTAAAHNMRTKHKDCMAGEVLEREYLFSICPKSGEMPDPPFTHNELHDLESLWWTAVYMIFFMLDASFNKDLDEEGVQANSLKRTTVRKTLFPGSDITENRQDFLTEPDKFLGDLDWIPDSLNDIRTVLDQARSHLVESYFDFERNFKAIDLTEVYDAFISSFASCMELAASVENRFGTTLIIAPSDEPAVSTTDHDTDADKVQDTAHQDLPAGAGNDSGTFSRQGRRSQKRKRSPEGKAGSSRSRIAEDTDS